MPTKPNRAGEQQPMKSNGEYASFSNFQRDEEKLEKTKSLKEQYGASDFKSTNDKRIGNNKVDYHSENKAKMLKHNLSSYERYNIYHSIDEDSVNKSLEEGDYSTIEVDGLEIEYQAHTKETDDGIEYDNEIISITNYQKKMKDLLKEKGIEFQESWQSNSLYFTYKGKSYRISDHKRPMQEYYDPNEEQDFNIVEKNISDRYEKLKKILD